MKTKFEFKNNAPDNKEWTVFISILNKYTSEHMRFSFITHFMRSRTQFPLHMYTDLMKQYTNAHARSRAVKAVAAYRASQEKKRLKVVPIKQSGVSGYSIHISIKGEPINVIEK